MHARILVAHVQMWLKKEVVGSELQTTSYSAGEVGLSEVVFVPGTRRIEWCATANASYPSFDEFELIVSLRERKSARRPVA